MSELGDLSKAVDDLATAATTAAKHYCARKPGGFRALFSELRVPLTTIFVTTVLSVWLIPIIEERSAAKKFNVETKLQKSLEAIHHAITDSERINEMRTAFELYEEEASELPTDEEMRGRRELLKKTEDEIYANFDSSAWWWHQELVAQVSILKLIPDNQVSKLGDAANRYSQNLAKTAGLFKEARRNHLGGKDELHPKDIAPLVHQMAPQLYPLYDERMRIVHEIVSILK